MPIIFQKVIHVCANCKTFLLYAGREWQRAELSNFDQDDINSNTFFALNLIENQIFNDSSHLFFWKHYIMDLAKLIAAQCKCIITWRFSKISIQKHIAVCVLCVSIKEASQSVWKHLVQRPLAAHTSFQLEHYFNHNALSGNNNGKTISFG